MLGFNGRRDVDRCGFKGILGIVGLLYQKRMDLRHSKSGFLMF